MIVSTDQEPGSAATPTVGIKIGWALLAVLFIAWMLVCFSFGLILLRWRTTQGFSRRPTPVRAIPSRHALQARGMVFLDLFGRVVAVPPGAGDLLVPLSDQNGFPRHLSVRWSGPAAAWPMSHREPSKHWRIYEQSTGGTIFLTPVPLVPGFLVVRGSGQPKPNLYAVVMHGPPEVLEVNWFGAHTNLQRHSSIFPSTLQNSRKIALQCAQTLMHAGAASWIAALKSRHAVAELAKYPDQEVYLLGIGDHLGRIHTGPVIRLAARIAIHRSVWRPGGNVVYRGKLDSGEVYLYRRPLQESQAHAPHLVVWRWLFFGRSGRRLAWGQISCPPAMAPVGVLRRVRASAGIGLEAPDAVSASGDQSGRSSGKSQRSGGDR
jgi:hypothetical protein